MTYLHQKGEGGVKDGGSNGNDSLPTKKVLLLLVDQLPDLCRNSG